MAPSLVLRLISLVKATISTLPHFGHIGSLGCMFSFSSVTRPPQSYLKPNSHSRSVKVLLLR